MPVGGRCWRPFSSARSRTASRGDDLLVAFAVVVGLGDGLFYPAFGGMVPLVVEQPSIPSATALIGVARWSSLLLGPAFAGLLYEPIGPAVPENLLSRVVSLDYFGSFELCRLGSRSRPASPDSRPRRRCSPRERSSRAA